MEQKAQKIVNQSGNNAGGGGGGAKLTGFAVKTTLENSKNSKLLQLSNELSVLYERTMRPPQQNGVELVQMDAYLFYLYVGHIGSLFGFCLLFVILVAFPKFIICLLTHIGIVYFHFLSFWFVVLVLMIGGLDMPLY